MIPNRANDQILIDYLACEIDEVCEAEAWKLQQVAHSVLFFMRHHGLTEPFENNLLAILIARSLSGLGWQKEADGFLARQISDEDLGALYQPFINCHVPFDLRVWQLIRAGVLTRYSGALAGKSTHHWVLDLSRVPTGHDTLDLTTYLSVKKLIELFAPIWKAAGGAFSLGLHGLPDCPTGAHRRKRIQAPPSASDLLAYAREILELMRRTNGWQNTPELRSMELRVRNVP